MELKSFNYYFVNTLIVFAIILVVGAIAMARPAKVPGRLQNFIEVVIDGLRGLFASALGEESKGFLPLAIALFLFILLSNIIGQVPLFTSPTANPSTTVGLGTMVFLIVQAVGIKRNGIVGYLKHFAGPILFLAPLLFVIELVSELTKPFSLGMRLFGNIYAEDYLNDMAAKGGLHLFGLPTQFPVYFLQLFTDVVQAVIFSLLTCAYISLMTPHHDQDHGGSDMATKPG